MGQQYMNLHCYSDVIPYEVVRVVSEKCVEIRQMSAELAPGERPVMLPGGFCGHCVNQRQLKYVISPQPEAQVIRARLGKRGWKSAFGRHVPADAPKYFYDYNF